MIFFEFLAYLVGLSVAVAFFVLFFSATFYCLRPWGVNYIGSLFCAGVSILFFDILILFAANCIKIGILINDSYVSLGAINRFLLGSGLSIMAMAIFLYLYSKYSIDVYGKIGNFLSMFKRN